MEDKIIFYSTHCPKCAALEMLLKKNNIDYVEKNDVQEMISLGLTSAPALKIGEQVLDFVQAMKWVRGQ